MYTPPHSPLQIRTHLQSRISLTQSTFQADGFDKAQELQSSSNKLVNRLKDRQSKRERWNDWGCLEEKPLPQSTTKTKCGKGKIKKSIKSLRQTFK